MRWCIHDRQNRTKNGPTQIWYRWMELICPTVIVHSALANSWLAKCMIVIVTYMVTQIACNLHDAFTCYAFKNSPGGCWSGNYIALQICFNVTRLLSSELAQPDNNFQSNQHILSINCNELNTFTMRILLAEASSTYRLFTESRYRTSENPLSFALIMACITYATKRQKYRSQCSRRYQKQCRLNRT